VNDLGEKIKDISLKIGAIIKSPHFENDITGAFDKIETDLGLHYFPSSNNTKRIGFKTVGLSLPIVFIAPVLSLAAIPLIDDILKGRKSKDIYGDEFDPSSFTEGLISLPFKNFKQTLLTNVKINKAFNIFLKIYSSGDNYTLISYQGNAIINGIEIPVEIETAGIGKAEEFSEVFLDRNPKVNTSSISLKEFSQKNLISAL
jgi:hypothetical protein